MDTKKIETYADRSHKNLDTEVLSMEKRGQDHLLKFSAERPMKNIGRLREIPFFAVFRDDAHLEVVVENGTWLECPEGTILVREGEMERDFFVLIQGKVRVFKGKKTLALLTRGEILGEMGALLAEPRSANAVVTKDCYLYRMDVSVLKGFPQRV
ncbi:MAG: cyclic nucleotide-binding domain-containing protein, partial [Thermodesulfobacteriota bacterium]|nr:cyclic nucleotide-binding domain-containing protein [Thermodesulfobacteriota bacterium]